MRPSDYQEGRRKRRLATAARLCTLLLASALLVASAPANADDWDGIGFLASVDRFDMVRFSPHAPGYPVYVAALRVAHMLVRDPLAAAYVIAIVSAACAAELAFSTASRLWGAPLASRSRLRCWRRRSRGVQ